MNRIKELREQKGMKQAELGQLLNVNNSAISKYESGKLQLTDDTLVKLSDIFGVSIDYILSRNDNDEISPHFSVIEKIDIGRRLSQLRTKKGINQRELAQQIGVSDGTIGMWETGKRQPDLDTVAVLAKYYNVSTDYLLGLDIDSNKKNTISLDAQNILDIFYQDPEHITELLKSFSKLSVRNKTIVLGKCYELENDDEKSKAERLVKEKDFKQAT